MIVVESGEFENKDDPVSESMSMLEALGYPEVILPDDENLITHWWTFIGLDGTAKLYVGNPASFATYCREQMN